MQLLCFVSLSIIGGSAIFGNQFGKAVWKDDPQAYRRFAAFVQRVRGLWLPGSWKGKAAGNGETVTPSVSCLGCSDCRSQALDHIYCHSFVLKQFAEFAFLRNQLLKVGAAVSLQHLCHHEKQSGAVACGMRWACAHLAEPLGLHGGDTQNFSWHLRWCPVGADVDAKEGASGAVSMPSPVTSAAEVRHLRRSVQLWFRHWWPCGALPMQHWPERLGAVLSFGGQEMEMKRREASRS